MPQGLLPLLGSMQPDTWLPAVSGLGFVVVTLGIGFLAFSRLTRRQPTATSHTPAAPGAVGPPTFKIPDKAAEKRGFTRRGGNAVPVFYTTTQEDSEPQRGWVLDRSTGGLRLSLENAVEPGTVLRIRPCNTQVTAPWVEIEVKSCRPGRHFARAVGIRKAIETTWELSCQFVQTPSYNVLLLFG